MDEPMPRGGEKAFLVELEFSAEEIIPNHITIPAGEKILFVVYNSDTSGDMNEDHNLVSPDLGLREILVVPGQTVRRIWDGYDEPGTYKVGCTIHPWIVMEITVE
jgi:plastocyanin